MTTTISRVPVDDTHLAFAAAAAQDGITLERASFDWLCVPTDYHEPKGLYVLEAALTGVPSILPSHGAFPERVASLGSGTLYDATAADSLVKSLLSLNETVGESERQQLRQNCISRNGMVRTGQEVLSVLTAIGRR